VFDQDVLLLSSMMREIDTEQDADGDTRRSSLFAPFSRRSLWSCCFILFQEVAGRAEIIGRGSLQLSGENNDDKSTHLALQYVLCVCCV
jgi:hypothetical protein